MSHEYIDRNRQQNADANRYDSVQKKVDPASQLKWAENSERDKKGGGPENTQPAQKFSKDEEEQLQRKESEGKPQVKTGNSGTQTSLPEEVQAKMENSFGADFSNVNVHQNSEQSKNIGALAYTHGNDVHFAPGQYNPATQKGQEFLGHELTHVVQQREGRVQQTETPSPFKEEALRKKQQKEETKGLFGKTPEEQMQLKLKYGSAQLAADIARKQYNNYKKQQQAQLKRGKLARQEFNAKSQHFERTLIQQKVAYGSDQYNQMVQAFIPGYSAPEMAIQQAHDRVMGSIPVNDNPALEKEADVMGERAAQGKMATIQGASKNCTIQQKEEESNLPDIEDPTYPHAQGVIINEGGYTYYITAIHTEEGAFYTKEKFDTLYSISIRYGITVDEIKRLNPKIEANKLTQGQKILLSDNSKKEEKEVSLDPNHAQGKIQIEGKCTYYIAAIHTKKGALYSPNKFDTFWSIAVRCRITVDELKELNPEVDPDNLRQGQKILIKDGCKATKEEQVNPGIAPSWLGPTKPELFWKGGGKDKKIEMALYGKDLERTVIYETVGIHSNDKYFQNAHRMYVAHTYGDVGGRFESKYVEKYYFFDNGIKKWLEFNPNNIGMNAKEATNFVLVGVGGAAVIVGGLILLESGLVITSVKEILAKASMDALNQYIIKGADFDKIDWANVAASGLIKDKHLKNIVASALDYNIEQGFNDEKTLMDATIEFMVRTKADQLFEKYSSPKTILGKETEDVSKKYMRKVVMDVYKEFKKN